MATFRIDEYPTIGAQNDDVMPVPYADGMVTQTAITTSGTSQQSAAFNAETTLIEVESIGTAVYIALGTDPTASSTTKYLAADRIYNFAVPKGESWKVAVIDV